MSKARKLWFGWNLSRSPDRPNPFGIRWIHQGTDKFSDLQIIFLSLKSRREPKKPEDIMTILKISLSCFLKVAFRSLFSDVPIISKSVWSLTIGQYKRMVNISG